MSMPSNAAIFRISIDPHSEIPEEFPNGDKVCEQKTSLLEMSSVATEEMSSAATEEMSSVATEDISSVATEDTTRVFGSSIDHKHRTELIENW